MSKASKPKLKRVPLGKPLLPVTDDEIIVITPEDIERAKVKAAKFGNAEFNAMVNATLKEDDIFNG